MEKFIVEKYRCSICSCVYGTKEYALKCESKPITHDNNLKIGDEIIITSGDGNGEIAIVEKTFIIDMWWGHYSYERYWHTVGVIAKMKNSWGSRQLTFDSYKFLK